MTGESPFAALVLHSTKEKTELFLPLTLTYLLSARIRFVLPISEDDPKILDAAFDELLKGHSLESQGISYRIGTTRDELLRLLQAATLVVTTDPELEAVLNTHQVPYACVVAEENGKGRTVKLQFLEKIKDQDLRGQLIGCAQLINLQSGGCITEGHFMLSW